MEPLNISDVNQFHQEIDAYLDRAEKGQLSEEQLTKLRDLIAKTPMEVTDTEKERLFAMQRPDDPTNPTTAKMSGIFSEIIDIVSAQTPEKRQDTFTNPTFMERLVHYLPAKETVRLANVSRDASLHIDKDIVDKINSNPDQSLKELGFSDIPSLLTFLSRNAQSIKSLNLKGFYLLNDDLQAIIAVCPHLISLSTTSIFLDDQGVAVIAKGLKQLKVLNLRGCIKITDAGAGEIANGLKQLTALELKGCNQITDVGAREIANGLKQLKVLNLFLCKGITDTAIDELRETHPSITFIR